MNRVAAVALLAGTVLSSPAFALDAPQPDKTDQNIRHLAYRATGRVLVVGTMSRSTVITVGPNESIVRVIFGNDEIWEGPDPKELASAPLRNNLPLWPKKIGKTNMQVITSEPGKPDKVYQFATVVRAAPADDSDDPDATYGLTFSYPRQEREAAIAAATARRAATLEQTQVRQARVHLAAARAKLQAVAEDPENWRYTARGTATLTPAEVSDNGQTTAFRFPGNMQLPAIYAVGLDGKEQIVPFSMQGDRMLVQRIAREFHLRLGDAVLYVYNRAYDPVGQNPGTGTTSPDVVREIRRVDAS